MRSLLARALGVCLVLSSAPEAMAFVHHDAALKGTDGQEVTVIHRVVRPGVAPSRRAAMFDAMFGGNGQTQIDRHSGAVRVMSGYQFLSLPTDLSGASLVAFEQAALDFIVKHPKIFGVTAANLQLETRATVHSKTETFLKFRVLRNGVLVQDAVIDVRFKHGRLAQVVNQSFAEAADDQRILGAEIDRNLASVLGATDYQHVGQVLRVVENKRGYALKRVEEFRATIGGEPVVAQIDSADGSVFEVAPTRYYARGRARASVHPRTWKQALVDDNLSEMTLTHSGGSATTGIDGSFDLGAGQNPELNGLVGTRIKITPVTGDPAKTTGTLTGSVWDVFIAKEGAAASHEDKQIAQSMIYVHANKIIRHAKNYIDSPWLDQPLEANANLDSSCNAHWDGSTINLYSAGDYGSMTCANTGLISDVVYHEWGHGLDEHTGGIEDGAYSEGFGDICSLVMTRSNELGPDFTTDGMVVRDLAPDKIYPQDTGEVHDEGLIIGSTFYDLYQALELQYGGDKAIDLIANYAFKSIKTASKYTDVYDAVLVIDDNDGNLANGTPNLCTINEAFSNHGLTTRSDACKLGRFASLIIDDSAGNNNAIVEPGEAPEVNIELYNSTPQTLADLKGTVSLVNPVAGVTIGGSAISWEPLAPEESGATSDGFTLQLDNSVPCGTKLALNVKLEGNGRTVFEKSEVLVGRLLGTEKAYAAAGLPLEIKDKDVTNVPTKVSGSQWQNGTKVQGASVSFSIKHSYVGDLVVSLKSPSGKVIHLVDGTGSGDELAFSGDVSAEVMAEAGLGEWQLVVEDKYEVDTGTVEAFELKLTPALFECRF